MACRFCDIITGADDYVVWQDELFLALLDTHPAKRGQLMIIPKKHVDYFFDMDEELCMELFKRARLLEEPLRKATNAQRIGLAVVGFSVPHAHLHLIPLHGPNELFDPSLFSEAEPEELKKVQKMLSEAFLG